MKTYSLFIEEARKRMTVLRTAHYTSSTNKENILKSGFKDSPSTGTYHPDNHKRTVYTTPSSRVGSDYGHSRVNLKIVNPKIQKTNSPETYRQKVKDLVMKHDGDDLQKRAKEISPIQQSRRAIEQGHPVVKVPRAHGGFHPTEGKPQGSYIMVDRDVANKSIDRNPSPTIKSNKPRRTNIRPKKI